MLEVRSDALERPWLEHYPEGVPHSIDPLAMGTLADLIRSSCARYADRPAFESFGKSITYGETKRVADALAAAFQARGLKKGDRIALMMPNVLAYPASMFAVLLGGYTVVNVNPLYTPRELVHQLNDSGARAIVVLENFAHVVQEALPSVKLDLVVVASAGDLMGLKGLLVNLVARHVKKVVKLWSIPGSIGLKALIASGESAPPNKNTVGHDDIAFLQYTGGTTGVAKGAVLLQRNITANIAQCDAWITPCLKEGEPQQVMVTALPLYHIFALTGCCLYMVRIGACCLLIANPRDVAGFVKSLKGRRITMISGVNTLFNAMMNDPGFRDIDASALKFAIAGGMAMQAPVARRWKEMTGKAIVEGYGLSETSPVVAVNPLTIDEFSGTIGYPVPSTDVVVRRVDGSNAPVGEAGELCVRGPQVMAGYWQRPAETQAAMTPDGFFRTGDVAIMLPDGQIKIVDRMKDMVLVSGFNVYPNEVEEVLVSHPGVLEAAVIGLPDAHSGEIVSAYVVRKDPALTEEALKSFAKANLTGYKVPRQVVFRDALPKSNVGKVLRRALREEVLGIG